jgi:hypothetical protein
VLRSQSLNKKAAIDEKAACPYRHALLITGPQRCGPATE